MTFITDHVDAAKARLLEQYKDKPNFEALLDALIEQIQALEDTFKDLALERGLTASTGIQLDRLGTIVGQTRKSGQTDESYRKRIAARIVQNISQGEPELVVSLYKLLVSATTVILIENFPASVTMMSNVDVADQDEINDLYAQIELVLPAGVRLEGLGYFNGPDGFSMAGLDEGSGFGDLDDASAGGEFGWLWPDTRIEFAFDGDDLTGGGFGSTVDPLVGGVFE